MWGRAPEASTFQATLSTPLGCVYVLAGHAGGGGGGEQDLMSGMSGKSHRRGEEVPTRVLWEGRGYPGGAVWGGSNPPPPLKIEGGGPPDLGSADDSLSPPKKVKFSANFNNFHGAIFMAFLGRS